MKAAVFGAGRMGRRHMQVVRDLGLQLAAVADPREESLAEAAKEHSLGPGALFRDAKSLLAALAPDVAIVAATAPAHAELTRLAAAAGARYVLCEKPMASSLAQCREMIETCERRGTRLAVNHQMRVMDQYVQIKRITEAPDFGGWRSITVVGGNFGAAMNGTHYFELFRWLSGEAPTEVSAWFAGGPVASPRGPEFHDRAGSIRVTSASGRRLYLEIGEDQGHGVRATYAGRFGIAVSDELLGTIHVSTRREADRGLPSTRYGLPSLDRVVLAAPNDAVLPTRKVLEALLAGGDYPTGAEGRLALATLAAAYVSSESGGRPVAVDLDSLPQDRRFDFA
ncbi:MAG: Gfo/Idh/MocA family oxidoreductase [Elusimicrobia bacterium]|nr:Gfo/Idh/MocA family oxidoreductase [Elusimicrobiota bacterium]